MYSIIEKLTILPKPYQITFNDPVTHTMYHMIELHHNIMIILVFIISLVVWMLTQTIRYFNINNVTTIRSNITHNSFLEIIWTMLPTLILMLIAYPSFMLLYTMDAIRNPVLTIKIIGNQWYWTYNSTITCGYIPEEFDKNYHHEWKYIAPFNNNEKNNQSTIPTLSRQHIHMLDIYREWYYQASDNNCFKNRKAMGILQFDSYMIPEADLVDKNLRLLEVDKYLFIPMRTQVRLLVSANDVLHSWTIPSFGIKIDGCPGRQNEVPLNVYREGTFFGQCSELCGINHAFMPIKVWVLADYFQWYIAMHEAVCQDHYIAPTSAPISKEIPALDLTIPQCKRIPHVVDCMYSGEFGIYWEEIGCHNDDPWPF